ncbi:MAG: hypothetical protein AAGA90_05685 [Actinomycetota bacterium]
MTTVFERVRLTVGLAHAAPGATLVVDTNDGDRVEVHRGPDADVDVCALRRSVIVSARLGRPDQAWSDTSMVIGGLLECHRGDIHRRRVGAVEHWFATLLHPGHVFDRIEALDVEPDIAERVEVTLKPDPGLGVTLVAVRAVADGTEADVAEAAERAWAACVADEFALGATRADVPVPDPARADQEPNR